MIAAIGLGIGVCMTTLSIYYLSSSNPVRYKNDLLFAVTMDGWDPAKPFDEDDHPDLPPWELTYKDAMAIRQSDIPTRQAAMFKATFIVQPERRTCIRSSSARATDSDFFALSTCRSSTAPAGIAWTRTRGQVAVINKETDRVFGGRTASEDSRSTGGSSRSRASSTTIPPLYCDVTRYLRRFGGDLHTVLAGGAARGSLGGQHQLLSRRRNLLRGIPEPSVWIRYWVQLDGSSGRNAITPSSTARRRRSSSGASGSLNNRLTKVGDWLKIRNAAGDDSRCWLDSPSCSCSVTLNTVRLLLAKLSARRRRSGLAARAPADALSVFGQPDGGGRRRRRRRRARSHPRLGRPRGVQAMLEEADRFAHLDFNMLALGLAIALLSSFAAGLYPTWRVCRMSPAPFLKTQ